MTHRLSDAKPVESALRAFGSVHADTIEIIHAPVFVRARMRNPKRRVGIVSGGGAGHEPLHIGFVGEGMLDAACPGQVFTSPHNRQIYQASRSVAGEEGVLHIVKNYTGDLINFAIAAERLHADGIACERVVVDDDLATDGVEIGRRGTGATLIVEKICGAAADEGVSLGSLAAIGRETVSRSRSIAAAIRAHSAPFSARSAFDIAAEHIEYGVGIHGERARTPARNISVDEAVSDMVNALLDAVDKADETLAPHLLLFVNDLGAMSELELYQIADRALAELEDRGRPPARVLVQRAVTALDMRGFSITLAGLDDDALRRWDAPARTVAWRG